MINYEHIKAGIAIINEFRKELKALCDRYQVKLSEACPEDIGERISDVADHHLWIHLIENCPEEHFSTDEIVSDGFEYDYSDDFVTAYKREIDGVVVYARVHKAKKEIIEGEE